MNAEQLHDAISLLPADLIAEADKKRSAPPTTIRWQRYAAMAACFVLVLFSSLWYTRYLYPGATEKAAQGAPAAEAPAAAAPEITCSDPADAAPQMEAAPESQEFAKDAPREEALDTGGSSDENSNTACYGSTPAPSVTLRIGGLDYPLTGEDKTALRQILEPLEFREEDVCECIAEITILAGDTAQYHINLDEGFVRCARGQAMLTQEQIDALRAILNRLENGQVP